VAVAGIALIALPDIDGGSADGIALALLTGALYVPLALLNKALSDTHGGTQLALWQLLIAGVVLLPFGLASDWDAPAGDLAWLLVLGVVYTAVAFATYLTALERLPATRAAVLLYVEPASAVLFGWLLLSEDPTISMLVGGVLVLGAGVLVVRVPMAPEVPPVAADAAG
jgi:drug/metabolite transporter (DMT)-like permease